MTYAREVTCELFEKDGTLLGAVDMSYAFNIEFYDERNGVGWGQISLPLSEAAAAEVTQGRFVNIKVAGTSRFTFKIQGRPTYTQRQVGGESQWILTVRGQGWAITFDEAIIYPETALNSRLDSSWRLFSFASPSFPNGGAWPAAVELYEWLDGVTYGVRAPLIDGNNYPAPVNFPAAISFYDPLSPPGASYVPIYWIWTEQGFPNEEYQLGWGFFRATLTLSADTVVTFAVSADNYFTFFVDGVPIIGEKSEHNIWKGWKEVGIPMLAGSYTIAAVVENIGFPGQTGPLSTNPAGFIMTAHEVNNSDVATDIFKVSDSSWTAEFVSNVDRWPGWTPGQIIDKLITEATAVGRDALAVYNSSTFTATLDSDGLAWRPLDTGTDTEYVASFAMEVGQTVLEALQELHDRGWIEWAVRPGTFILDVWRGRLPSPTSSATLTSDAGIISLERAETAPYANALLVQWEEGFVEVRDTAAITAHGTAVEDIFASDATSALDAETAGEIELIKRAQEGLPSIVMTWEPLDAATCPYEGFTKGDWVTIPDTSGGTEDVRVLSIACRQDDEGFAEWTLELNNKLLVPERQQADLFREIGGRSGVARGRVR